MFRILLSFFALTLGLWPLGPSASPEGARVSPGEQPYVGAERCRACHPAAYAKWEKSPHARALHSVPQARRGDPKCIVCHSPDPGGALPGVQCESCHGPGRDYSHAFVMKDRKLARVLGLADPGERRCRACHSSHGLRGRWDYQKKLREITHWTR